jgi:hypothetical protein
VPVALLARSREASRLLSETCNAIGAVVTAAPTRRPRRPPCSRSSAFSDARAVPSRQDNAASRLRRNCEVAFLLGPDRAEVLALARASVIRWRVARVLLGGSDAGWGPGAPGVAALR